MGRGEPLFRQWNILKGLQANHFGLCADELAERVECSKRQVQRDLKILQDVGFPIFYEDRDFGKRFWRLSSNALESKQLMLSMTEMLSLFIGQQLLLPLSGTQFGDGLATAIEKIKAVLPGKRRVISATWKTRSWSRASPATTTADRTRKSGSSTKPSLKIGY